VKVERSKVLRVRKGWTARRLGVALAAAWLLLVQALSGSFALAAGRQHVPLDAFGNPLCITSANHDLPAPGSEHGPPPACCLLGCATGAPLAALPPLHAWLAVAFPTGPGTPPLLAREIAVPADPHDPASPRAPPRAG
jgi:hypothetical protein